MRGGKASVSLMLRSRTKCGISKHEAAALVPPSSFETLGSLAPQDEGGASPRP